MFEALVQAAKDHPLEFWGMVGNAATALLALAAIIVSAASFSRQIGSEHYGEIDKIYFDLLRELINRPQFEKGVRGADGAFEPGYEPFAFMMMNFVETIMDRCRGVPDLERTWQPIIEIEACNHLDWLSDKANQNKFKDDFLRFLARGGFHRYEKSPDHTARMRETLIDYA